MLLNYKEVIGYISLTVYSSFHEMGLCFNTAGSFLMNILESIVFSATFMVWEFFFQICLRNFKNIMSLLMSKSHLEI